MKRLLLLAATALLICPAFGEREFDIDGRVEQHVRITAMAGHEADFERTFRAVFYPALSSQKGFLGGALLRKPGTSDYIIRLAFTTEELRTAWVHSSAHATAWPKLAEYAGEPTWEGLSLRYPK